MTTSCSKSSGEIFKYFDLCIIGRCVFHAKLERSLFLAFSVTFNVKSYKSPKFFIGHVVGKTRLISLLNQNLPPDFFRLLWRKSNSGMTIFEYFS